MTSTKSRRAASRRRQATHQEESFAPNALDQMLTQESLSIADLLTTEEQVALRQEQELSSALSRLHGVLPSLASRPDVIAEVESILTKAQARRDAMATGNAHTGLGEAAYDFLTRGGGPPTGSHPQAAAPNGPLGGWAGVSEQPKGVMNHKILRRYADHDPWVNAALRHRKSQISRADIDVLPLNYDAPYSKDTQAKLRRLLASPNEYRESWATLAAKVTEDILVIDRGVISKNMTVKRIPTALYVENGATIKIYANWDGDARKPRYVFEEPSSTRMVPLRNDEAIVIMEGEASHRFSYSRVQVLIDTIERDLQAAESAARFVTDKPPPTAIVIPGANEYQLRRLRESYQSYVAGQRELFFLGGGGGGEGSPSVHSLNYSLRDNQMLELQQYYARTICAVFQVAPQSLGITMDVNRSTGGTQQDIEDDAGRLPLMLLIEEFLNRELVSDFAPFADDGRPDLEALNLGIVFPEITEASKILHVERLMEVADKGLAGLPFQTPNMILELMGEKPVQGGNTFYANTPQGPMPFLSYDSANPNYNAQGELGAQSPGSGPGAEDNPADAEAAGKKPPKTPAPPTQPSPAPQPVGDESSGSGSAPNFAAGYEPPYQRRPGRAWRPSPSRASSDQSLAIPPDTYFDPYLDLSYGEAEDIATAIRAELLGMTTKKPQSLGRVPDSISIRHHRPVRETEARARLQAAVRRVFSEAANRGNAALIQAAQGKVSAPVAPPIPPS